MKISPSTRPRKSSQTTNWPDFGRLLSQLDLVLYQVRRLYLPPRLWARCHSLFSQRPLKIVHSSRMAATPSLKSRKTLDFLGEIELLLDRVCIHQSLGGHHTLASRPAPSPALLRSTSCLIQPFFVPYWPRPWLEKLHQINYLPQATFIICQNARLAFSGALRWKWDPQNLMNQLAPSVWDQLPPP